MSAYDELFQGTEPSQVAALPPQTGGSYDDLFYEGVKPGEQPSIRRGTEAPPEPGFMSSKVGRFLQGAATPVIGAGQLAAHTLSALPGSGTMDDIASAAARKYQESRKAAGIGPDDWDYWAGAGQLAATATPMVRAAKLLSGAPSVLGSIMRGAGLGALGAASEPVKDTSQGYWGPKVEATALGGLIGGALGPVGEGAARVALPVIDENARWLAERGVNTTIGQTLGGMFKRAEDIAMSLPLVGQTIRKARERSIDDAMRAQGKEVLGHIRQTLPDNIETGNKQIGYMQDVLGKEFDDTYRSATLDRDKQFLRERTQLYRDLDRRLSKADADRADKETRSIITGIIAKAGASRGRGAVLNGEELQTIITRLRERETSLINSPTDAERQVGVHVGKFRKLVEDTAARQNPGFQQRLDDVSTAWWKFARMQAAAGQSSTIGHGGVYTPTGLSSATARLDPTLRHAGAARGEAALQDWAERGKSVLPSKVADSGTPERSFWMGLGSAATAGVFPLETALSLGAGLGSTHALYQPKVQDAIRRYLLSRSAPQQWTARQLREVASPAAEWMAGQQSAEPRYADGGGVGEYVTEGLEALGRAPGDVARYARDLPKGEGESPGYLQQAHEGANYAINATVKGLTGGRWSTPGMLGALGLPTGDLERQIASFGQRNPALLQTLGDVGNAAAYRGFEGAPEAVAKAPGVAARGVGSLGNAFENAAASAGEGLNTGVPAGKPPRALIPEQQALRDRSVGSGAMTPEQAAILESMKVSPERAAETAKIANQDLRAKRFYDEFRERFWKSIVKQNENWRAQRPDTEPAVPLRSMLKIAQDHRESLGFKPTMADVQNFARRMVLQNPAQFGLIEGDLGGGKRGPLLMTQKLDKGTVAQRRHLATMIQEIQKGNPGLSPKEIASKIWESDVNYPGTGNPFSMESLYHVSDALERQQSKGKP